MQIKEGEMDMKAKLKDNTIQITFQYDPDLVQKMRSLDNRKWNPDFKQWECVPIKQNIEKLAKWGFDLDDEIINLTLPRKEKVYKEIEVPGFKKTLMPFQKQGVAFLVEKNGRGLIADSMGLGKTVQAVAYLQAFPKIRPVLIICPKSAIGTWEREINGCMSDKKQIHILNGKTIKEIPSANIYIINYDILSSWIDALLDLPFELIILDEIHKISSRKTQRTMASQMIGKKTEKIIGLTGTPIKSRPLEIFNAISLINPKLFPNFFQFAKRYCNAKQSKWGWDFTGSSNTQELHEILTSTCMIRRLKKDVLPDLPEKTRTIIPVKIDNMEEYKFAERSFSEWLLETKDKVCMSAEALTQIEYLKQIAAKGKLDEILDWIEDVVEQGEKLVVMAHHKEIIKEICSWLEKNSIKYVKLIGGSSDKERKETEEKFQIDESIKVFVGSSAAEEAITLTAASMMAIIELPWTPGSLDQREDRIHRIGQTKGCNYYYFIAEKTIEEAILKLLDAKRKTITAILDGKDVDEKSILLELLDELREERRK